MNFNVIGADGAVYGPVDEDTLKQWVEEARVLPNTMIEEVGRGRRFEAKTMASLFPPQMPGDATAQARAGVLHSGYDGPKSGTTGVGQVVADPNTAAAAFSRVMPTSGYSSATSKAPINNHIFKAIFSILFFLPIAIPAIMFATQVQPKQSSGDRIGAQESADKANLYANIACWLGAFIYVGIAVAYIVITYVMPRINANHAPPPAQ